MTVKIKRDVSGMNTPPCGLSIRALHYLDIDISHHEPAKGQRVWLADLRRVPGKGEMSEQFSVRLLSLSL